MSIYRVYQNLEALLFIIFLKICSHTYLRYANHNLKRPYNIRITTYHHLLIQYRIQYLRLYHLILDCDTEKYYHSERWGTPKTLIFMSFSSSLIFLIRLHCLIFYVNMKFVTSHFLSHRSHTIRN